MRAPPRKSDGSIHDESGSQKQNEMKDLKFGVQSRIAEAYCFF